MLIAIMLITLYQTMRNSHNKKIDIAIKSIIVWNCWSFFLVELLSYMKLLTSSYIIWGWCIFDVVLIVLIIIRAQIYKATVFSLRKIAKKDWEWVICSIKSEWQIIVLLVTGIIVLLLAFLTVPYNWDSMTYHLPRIMHWIQNRSVAHYAANDVRQLASPVLAEFVNLQVYLLTGRRDVFFNFLQAVSYLADAWLIYEISKKIQTHKKYAVLAVFVFMTMPIAFAEALNTQVDLFATLWILIFMYYYIDLLEKKLIIADKETILKAVLMALSISFGYLTKPSVNVGMAFLLLILLIKCLFMHNRFQELFKLILIVIPFVFFPLLPEWFRNYQTFLALGDPTVGARQLIGTLQPNYIVVNTIKNFAHNFPSIYIFDSEILIRRIVSVIATILQVNLNDPTISEDGLEYIMKEPPVYGHDTATNPVILILAVFCFLFYLIRNRKRKTRGNRYTIYSMIMFILFCSVVRWEPYVSRYMLPYLALLCPMVGYQLQEIISGERKVNIGRGMIPIVYFLCLSLLISLFLYHKQQIPENINDRSAGYFTNSKGMYPEYKEVFLKLIENDYQSIGIKISSVNFEYPMWRFMEGSTFRIENVIVENVSSKYEDISYIPDCVIMDREQATGVIMVHGQEYCISEEFQNNEYIAVYVKK